MSLPSPSILFAGSEAGGGTGMPRAQRMAFYEVLDGASSLLVAEKLRNPKSPDSIMSGGRTRVQELRKIDTGVIRRIFRQACNQDPPKRAPNNVYLMACVGVLPDCAQLVNNTVNPLPWLAGWSAQILRVIRIWKATRNVCAQFRYMEHFMLGCE